MIKLLCSLAALVILAQPAAWGEADTKNKPGMIKETFPFAVKDGDTLRLDVYYNPTIPYEGKRPIVIFSFGGGWEAGARADGSGTYTPFLNRMTDYGYVTVGIDYRLGYLEARKNGDVKDTSITWSLISRKMDRNIYEHVYKAIAMAVEDLYDATTYMVENADRWNADPGKIVIGGISAGGVNSITAEYWSANQTPMALEHLPKDFRYAGVISGCGAIWHDFDNPIVWKRMPCPTMFVHGDSDNIVPYKEWIWKDYNFHIEGGNKLASFYRNNNLPYMLVSGTGGDHNYGGYAFASGQNLIHLFITNLIINKKQTSYEMVETPLPAKTEAKP